MNKLYEDFLGKNTSAYDLLSYLEKKELLHISPPIEIETIVNALGITYLHHPDFKKIKIDGQMFVKDGKPYVWSNPLKTKMEERKRFTVAHELGHFFKHVAPHDYLSDNKVYFNDRNISFNRDDNWDYKEMEANNFAAQLLMPSGLLIKSANEKLSTDKDITFAELVDGLSITFNVSKTAMKYRLEQLGVDV